MFLEFKANSVDSTKLLIFKLSKQIAEREQKGYGFEGDLQAPGLNKGNKVKDKKSASGPDSTSAKQENRNNDMQSLLEDEDDLELGQSEQVKSQRTA